LAIRYTTKPLQLIVQVTGLMLLVRGSKTGFVHCETPLLVHWPPAWQQANSTCC